MQVICVQTPNGTEQFIQLAPGQTLDGKFFYLGLEIGQLFEYLTSYFCQKEISVDFLIFRFFKYFHFLITLISDVDFHVMKSDLMV